MNDNKSLLLQNNQLTSLTKEISSFNVTSSSLLENKFLKSSLTLVDSKSPLEKRKQTVTNGTDTKKSKIEGSYVLSENKALRATPLTSHVSSLMTSNKSNALHTGLTLTTHQHQFKTKPTEFLSTKNSFLVNNLQHSYTNSNLEQKLHFSALKINNDSKRKIKESASLCKIPKLEKEETLEQVDKDDETFEKKDVDLLVNDRLYDMINSEQKTLEEELNRMKRIKLLQKAEFIQNKHFKPKQSQLSSLKSALINVVSSSLLHQPNFKDQNDTVRSSIINFSEQIMTNDPEFILKLAMYTRKELNIRITANFLLCLASFKNECRPFLQRYFKLSVALPSDWIEIAEMYQLFMDKKLNFGALPSALRKCMVEKFPDFDQYQLAKYNKEKSRMGKNKKLKDVKHLKTRITTETGEGEDTIAERKIEDKYIKEIKNGLVINDHIKFEVAMKENCTNLKIDVLHRKTNEEELKNNATQFKKVRRGKEIPKEKVEIDEAVAVRINLDNINKRITQRSYLNKTWSKTSSNVTSTDKYDFEVGAESKKFYLIVTSSGFCFGFKKGLRLEELCFYAHSKHKIALNQLNMLRISGCGVKMVDLVIESECAREIVDQESTENDSELVTKSFTLKQLIRQLHISSPPENVMALLGKKYPMTYEEFLKSKLPGIFDSEKCGKRMKLPIPQTWETQISMKGNKAEVWQQLIDDKKLPYMAMLRNLRNMIKAGISEKHHQWVLKKLQDEGAVINSKQFPFRFFTAYEVLDELEDERKKYIDWCTIHSAQASVTKRPNKKEEKLKNQDINYDDLLLKRYKTALDNALKVATTHNVSPIKGSTIIFLNLSDEMSFVNKQKGLSKKLNTVTQIAALFALMFKYSCEHSKLVVFDSSFSYTDIELEDGTILDNMKDLLEMKRKQTISREDHNYPYSQLQKILLNKEYYDNLVFLSNGVKDVAFQQQFLRKYRSSINEDLLFVNVNLLDSECNLKVDPNFDHENDVNISGFSDSILRFVAERGNQGQLLHVDNIDKSYDLPVLKEKHGLIEEKFDKMQIVDRPKLKLVETINKWQTLKVFVSSTFRDMHSERDILSRTVFPMLRLKLSPYLINLNEVDLRWGITEQMANDNQTLDICLNHVLSSDYFVCMLGQRYGQQLDTYLIRNHSDLKWLLSYPPQASITELEIECQLQKKQIKSKYENTFFYFRNQSVLDSVPREHLDHFVESNEQSIFRLKALKSKIRSQPFEIYDNYNAKWFKCESNEGHERALLTDLDSFAHRVFNNLFVSILNNYKKNESEIELDEMSHLTHLNEAYVKLNAESFVGRVKLLKKLELILEENRIGIVLPTTTEAARKQIEFRNSMVHILLVTGETGSGKTSLLCKFINNHTKVVNHKFVHCVGSFKGSEYVTLFLKRFCIQTIKAYSLNISMDGLNESYDFDLFKQLFDNVLSELNNLLGDEKFYLVIDDVDLFLSDKNTLDNSFSWLPAKIPSKICLILAAKTTSETKSVLNKMSRVDKEGTSQIKLDLVEMDDLDLLEKSEFVRCQLSQFNKQLDESPFNNQMKLLTGKRDAAQPFYLSVACEQLRLHNQFETLTAKIKQLPSKLNLLIEFNLSCLQETYSFATLAFVFISCSREGLLEQELRDLLNLFYSARALNLLDTIESKDLSFLIREDPSYLKTQLLSKNRIATTTYYSFVESIEQVFLKPRGKNAALSIKSNSLVENCLRSVYAKSFSGKTDNQFCSLTLANKLMALYYWSLIDPELQLTWCVKNHQRAYTYLTFHLCIAQSYSDFGLIVTDMKFLANKCEQNLTNELMNDFDLHQSYPYKNLLYAPKTAHGKKSFPVISNNNTAVLFKTEKFVDYKTFITTNYHLLSTNPTIIYQQALNQPDHTWPAKDLRKLLATSNSVTFMFECLSKKSDPLNQLPTVINEFNQSVCSVCIAPNELLVACGTQNCEIKLFSLKTAALIQTFQGHSGKITNLCFAGNSLLCSTSSDGKACIWDTKNGMRLKILDKHNGHAVSSCCADKLGKTLITAGWDCSVKIWQPLSGELLGELKGHPKAINCVVFDTECLMVATGCWDSNIRIFNLFDRTRKAVLRGHKTSIRSIAYSNNNVFLASASLDGAVKLWNAKSGIPLASLSGHSMEVNSLKFSPSNQFLITGSTDQRVKVWSGQVGKMVRVISDEQNKQPITCVCFNQKTGEQIAAGYHSGEIRIYELYGGALLSLFHAHKGFVKRIKYSFDGSFLISSSEDGTVKIIDLEINVIVGELLLGISKPINALAISKNNVIVVGSEDGNLAGYVTALSQLKNNFDMFETNEKEEIKTNKIRNFKFEFLLDDHKSPITSCCFNNDGDKFASASKNSLIIIWSYKHKSCRASELLRIDSAHSDWITDLSWSNSADFILTSSNDYTLKVWNADNGKEYTQLKGHTANINSCAFQYGCAVSTCFDGSVKVWSHKGHEVANLTGHQSRVNGCDLWVKLADDQKGQEKKKELETEDEMSLAPLWGDEPEPEVRQLKPREQKKVEVEEVYLATVSDDATIRIWKPIESDYISNLENQNGKINSVDLSQNGIMATASSDQTVNLWDLKPLFDNFLSGLHVSFERVVTSHKAEITSIACTDSNKYIISSSFDGMVIIWKYVFDSHYKVHGLKFCREMPAHDKPCNAISIIKETLNENTVNILFATCSNDQRIKIWKFGQNILNEKSSIKLVQTLSNSSPVLFIQVVSLKQGKFLVSIEQATNRLNVRLYNLNQTNNISISKNGCSIIGESLVINKVYLEDGYLYITLSKSQILTINLDDLNSFVVYNLSNPISNCVTILKVEKENKLANSSITWFSSTCRSSNRSATLAGDWRGKLYLSNDKLVLNKHKKLHDDAITEMVSFRTKSNEHRLITASKDATIKIWTKDAEFQLGQFNSSSAITTLIRLNSHANTAESDFIFGDKFGNITLLKWHDQST